MSNLDQSVVDGFGDEWSRFDQSGMSDGELLRYFEDYFSVFPWEKLPPNATGFDLGCGSGRWAKLVAPRVGTLHLIDPSAAINVARRNLKTNVNCVFHHTEVATIPNEVADCDFGYSLGVLHHVPDTLAGLKSCVQRLKVGAPFLVYLYYRFDNRPFWFRAIWKMSDFLRKGISRLPHSLRFFVSQVFAACVYWPLARTSYLLEKVGLDVSVLPLSQYRHSSFYTMRTDALDRFGTKLEKRFTKVEIERMMTEAGLENITFAEKQFWTAVGFKRKQ